MFSRKNGQKVAFNPRSTDELSLFDNNREITTHEGVIVSHFDQFIDPKFIGVMLWLLARTQERLLQLNTLHVHAVVR